MLECVTDKAEIDVVRDIAFKAHSAGRTYRTTRGLFSTYSDYLKKVVQGYNELLPGFIGCDFVNLIDTLLDEQNVVNLLDCGCGSGKFLIDCKLRWGSKINCAGITAASYDAPYNETLGSTTQAATSLGVEIQTGDMQNLPRYFKTQGFDVVTAIRAIEYVADPWAVMMGIDKLLARGGIALIQHFPPTMNSDSEEVAIGNYLWTQYGVRITNEMYTHFDMVYRKTRGDLVLPIACNGVDNNFPVVLYTLTP